MSNILPAIHMESILGLHKAKGVLKYSLNTLDKIIKDEQLDKDEVEAIRAYYLLLNKQVNELVDTIAHLLSRSHQQ